MLDLYTGGALFGWYSCLPFYIVLYGVEFGGSRYRKPELKPPQPPQLTMFNIVSMFSREPRSSESLHHFPVVRYKIICFTGRSSFTFERVRRLMRWRRRWRVLRKISMWNVRTLKTREVSKLINAFIYIVNMIISYWIFIDNICWCLNFYHCSETCAKVERTRKE